MVPGEFLEHDIPEEELLAQQADVIGVYEAGLQEAIIETALRWWATRRERHRSAVEVDEATLALDKAVGKLVEVRA